MSKKDREFGSDFKLSIIMPAFNEMDTIDEILDLVLSTPYSKEIIIVDDFSTDGTREKLDNIDHDDVKVLFHEKK